MKSILQFNPGMPSLAPVFVFASGHRCGSTLLQRLLNSGPDRLIWGEHNGYLNGFLFQFEELLDWEMRFETHRRTFLRDGFDNFVPNMVPEAHELIDAARVHILALFGIPALKMGCPNWGFKEIRYGHKMAVFLRKCFPEARFIHLTRNVIDCLRSLKRWEEQEILWVREWTEKSLQDWERINSSFMNGGAALKGSLFSVKYEEMIADSGLFTKKLADFLNIPLDQFDQSVFANKLGGSSKATTPKKVSTSELSDEEKQLLSRANLVNIAGYYGYDLTF